jgi:hypothetical protein
MMQKAKSQQWQAKDAHGVRREKVPLVRSFGRSFVVVEQK